MDINKRYKTRQRRKNKDKSNRMKDTTLPTLIDYVLTPIAERSSKVFLNIPLGDELLIEEWRSVKQFAVFLKQPLKLEMFIPCKDGVPLKEPYNLDVNVFDNLNHKEQNDWLCEQKEYQQAKERVIFKRFEWKNNMLYQNGLAFGLLGKENERESISDLEGKVQLVDKEYKQLK